MYDVEERLLLRRFQISANRSLDGVLDQLNSRTLTDAGPAALIDDPPSDDDAELLPASAAGAYPRIRARGVVHANHMVG
jgi:periodic tryptophan protein 2